MFVAAKKRRRQDVTAIAIPTIPSFHSETAGSQQQETRDSSGLDWALSEEEWARKEAGRKGCRENLEVSFRDFREVCEGLAD